jgi:predicted choloylglycine hydrolase
LSYFLYILYSEGRHLFGRNYDSSLNETFRLYKTYPKAKLSHIGFSSLLIGREDGINEAGLAIAVTGVPGRYANKLGLWDHIPVRVVLERCKTVKKAVNILEEIPHLWSKNFLLCDKRGNLAIVEASEQEVIVSYPMNGLAVITNHFQSKTMKKYYDEKYEMHNTRRRLNNVKL